jgi:hypothetical protein
MSNDVQIWLIITYTDENDDYASALAVSINEALASKTKTGKKQKRYGN